MGAPATRAAMGAFNAGADEAQALFVGGCVRNALLGLPDTDIDIATRLTPAEATARLERAGIKVVPTGLAHGTVTAVTDGMTFEITTLRRDVETDGRHAVVAFTDDWREDAARRDFTMNTLLADSEGHVYDPLGHGIADAEAGRVIFVGDPAERIAEDYLRVLRFFRFHAWYGRGMPDQAGLESCQRAASKLGRLSRERTGGEIRRLLIADRAVSTLRLMFDHNVLKDIPHLENDLVALQNLIVFEGDEGCRSVLTRLATLSGGHPDALPILEKFIVFSNAEKRIFNQIVLVAAQLVELSEKECRRAIFTHGDDGRAGALIAIARKDGDGQPQLRRILRDWQPPLFPMTGDDVLRLGVPAGPRVGVLIVRVKMWWCDADFVPNRDACLAHLAELAGSGPG